MDLSKRVLLITDAFPPDKSGRAEKMARRVKYLSRFGWNVTVLAPQTDSSGEQNKEDYSDSDVNIYRTPYLLQRRWPSLKHNKKRKIRIERFSTLDRILDLMYVTKGYIRWLPYAFIHGYKLAKDADVIFTINNPVSLHLIGLLLKILTRKPWVAGFRDAIVGYRYTMRGPEIVNRLLERAIVPIF